MSIQYAFRYALFFAFLAPAICLAQNDAPAAQAILAASDKDNFAWDRLAELTDRFPARLSGSESLEQAIPWIVSQMKADGLENVHTEPVMVPHWVRGEESAVLVSSFSQKLAIAGFGLSVGTPPGGITADAIVVRSFDELEARKAEAKGRIVVFDVPFATNVDPWAAYNAVIEYRVFGASRAARLGAVAALVRAAGPTTFRSIHTGGMRYTKEDPQIPVAGLVAEDAEKLERMQKRGQPIRIHLEMDAHMEPDAPSANIVAELRGSEFPDHIVVMGGHIDSWDLAAGAMDDGGGCVAAWEALRLLHTLGLRPRRTLRVVLFTNEEDGLRGGIEYAERHHAELGNYQLAIETDLGVLPLKALAVKGSAATHSALNELVPLLAAIGVREVNDNYDGSDVMPMHTEGGVPLLSLDVDMNRYFTLHHTTADTVEHVDPVELEHAIAALAVTGYQVANREKPLPR